MTIDHLGNEVTHTCPPDVATRAWDVDPAWTHCEACIAELRPDIIADCDDCKGRGWVRLADGEMDCPSCVGWLAVLLYDIDRTKETS